jgi:hypothetical protein
MPGADEATGKYLRTEYVHGHDRSYPLDWYTARTQPCRRGYHAACTGKEIEHLYYSSIGSVCICPCHFREKGRGRR